MIAVIFEVEPSNEGFETYLEHAVKLKPLLTNYLIHNKSLSDYC